MPPSCWYCRGCAPVRPPHPTPCPPCAVPPPPRYVQNFVVDKAHPVSASVPSGRVPMDAMAELWFRDAAALRDWVASGAGKAFIHGQALLEPLYVLAVKEIRIV